MKGRKVQSLRSLREEMKAVARGEQPAPADASKPSFKAIEAVRSRRSSSRRGRVHRVRAPLKPKGTEKTCCHGR